MEDSTQHERDEECEMRKKESYSQNTGPIPAIFI
jgi:hypothetical protein